MSPPEVAVVVPTRGRESRLAFALEALEAQTIAPERFEVIVVRDSDVAGPRAALPPSIRGRELDIDVEAESSTPTAPALKRNRGWSSASAPLIAFCDDDCRPAPEWLEALLDRWGGETGVIVQGRTVPEPAELGKLHPLARTLMVEPPSPWFETANIAYPRQLLERVGGFDEGIGWFGEDTDLGMRAIASGARLRAAPRALVYHAVFHRGPLRAVSEQLHRRHTAQVVSRYPDRRRALLWGVFTNARYPALLAALVGLGASRRRPWMLLAALPYLRFNFDRSRLSPWGMVRMPMQLATRATVDAAAIIGGIVASIRHRTLVI